MYYQIYKYNNNIKTYGVIDKDGFIVIEAIYDDIIIAKNNFILKKNNFYGVLDFDGIEVVECKYDSITVINSGFLVEKDGFFGVLNNENQLIIEILYNEIQEIIDDKSFIVSLDSKSGVVKKGEFIIQMEYALIKYRGKKVYSIWLNNKVGIIDFDKKIKIEPNFDNITEFDKSGLSIASINRKLGFVNNLGEWIIYPQFTNVKPFDSNNISIVSSGELYGLVDKNGNWIVQPCFNSCESFKKQYLVKKDTKKYLIDKNGDFIKEVQKFDLILNFDENGLALYPENNLYGLINKSNKIIVEAKYQFLVFLFDNYYCFYENNKLGILSIIGEVIVEPEYLCHSWHAINDKKIQLSKADEHFIFDFDKKCLIKLDGVPLGSFRKNELVVARNKFDKYGVLNTSGEWIVKPIYDRLENQDENGYFKAYIDNRYGWIDVNGNWVIKPLYVLHDDETLKKLSQADENELYEIVMNIIKDVFIDDEPTVYFDDNNLEKLKIELDLDFIHGLKHLVFIDDSIDRSFSSGFSISYKNDEFYLILMEKWSKPVVISLNPWDENKRLNSINFIDSTCRLFISFENNNNLPNADKKLLRSNDTDSTYVFSFYNKKMMDCLVKFVDDFLLYTDYNN